MKPRFPTCDESNKRPRALLFGGRFVLEILWTDQQCPFKFILAVKANRGQP